MLLACTRLVLTLPFPCAFRNPVLFLIEVVVATVAVVAAAVVCGCKVLVHVHIAATLGSCSVGCDVVGKKIVGTRARTRGLQGCCPGNAASQRDAEGARREDGKGLHGESSGRWNALGAFVARGS